LPSPIIRQDGSSVSKENKSVDNALDKKSQSSRSKSNKNFKIDE
jgi:hypothetical protein